MGFMSAFVKASAYALTQQPTVNAVIDGSDIVYRDFVDVSVAVATPKGLVVPVLRNVEAMNYADIEKEHIMFFMQFWFNDLKDKIIKFCRKGISSFSFKDHNWDKMCKKSIFFNWQNFWNTQFFID